MSITKILIVLATALLVFIMARSIRPRRNSTAFSDPGIRLDQLPSLVEAMSLGSEHTRWAAILIPVSDQSSENGSVDLNLSYENGTIGFDWVLVNPTNIADKEKFEIFARDRGHEAVDGELNGVSYLRVEGGNVAQFATSVATEMYAVPQDEILTLHHEGFEWPRRSVA